MAFQFDNPQSNYLQVATYTGLHSATDEVQVTCWFMFHSTFGGNDFSWLAGVSNTTVHKYAIMTSNAVARSVQFRMRLDIDYVTDSSASLTEDVWYYAEARWTSGSNMVLTILDDEGTLVETLESSGTVSGTFDAATGPAYLGRSTFGFGTFTVTNLRVRDTITGSVGDDQFVEVSAADSGIVLALRMGLDEDPVANFVTGGNDATLEATGTDPIFVADPDVFPSGAAFPWAATDRQVRRNANLRR